MLGEDLRGAYPSCGNHRMNLSGAVDFQNGNLSVFAELRRTVGMPFNFLVDLSSRRE